MQISKDYLPNKRDPHLHSPDHVLADELSRKLGDQKNFAFYLKTVITHDHNVLRKIAGQILEGNSKTPGALFAYMVKKHNRERQVSEGYSIWLMPAGEEYDNLNRVIKSLAASYQTPSFEPHVTLLGNISHLSEDFFAKLNFNPITIDLEQLQTSDEFFKSFYLPVVKNKELNSARRMARKTFEIKAPETYKPHLSVIYGNFDPTKKLEMIRSLTSPLPNKLTLTTVALVNTNGAVSDWKILKFVNLTHDSQNS